MRALPRLGFAAIAVAVLVAAVTGGTFATFTAETASPDNVVSAAPDFVAPTASASLIAKTTGSSTGFVKLNGAYYIYANVSDTGNPASGTATVTADVGAISLGQSAAPLSAGSYSAGGQSFNYRSASLTADAALTDGTAAYTLRLTDNDANARTQSGFSVTVDNTAASASNVEAINKSGGTTRLAEIGDTFVLTYSEPIDPVTIHSSLAAGPMDVIVRVEGGSLLGLSTSNDVLTVTTTGGTAIPLGSVNLGRTDYATACALGLCADRATYGASGTRSVMSISGNKVTIVLGTADGNPTRAGGGGNMSWTPSSTPTDRAGNATSTLPFTESGSTPDF